MVRITSKLVRQVLDLESPPFTCTALGFADSSTQNVLTFLDDRRFLTSLLANSNVTAAFCLPEFASELLRVGKIAIECPDPRYCFYTLFNHLGRTSRREVPSEVSASASVAGSAYIAPVNVTIGDNVVIEPNVTVLSDVQIGEGSILRSGSVVGSEGFEQKRTSKGILPVFHDGGVSIGPRVEVGALTAIDKGMSLRQTIIGADCKFDNHVHIAHGVQMGERCLIAAGAVLSGSVTMQDDVYIGPGATISNQISIGTKAFITLGSVVTRNVEAGQTVTGNFAIPHNAFLRQLKRSLREE